MPWQQEALLLTLQTAFVMDPMQAYVQTFAERHTDRS